MSTACSSAEALYFKIARFNTRSIIWLLSQANAFENDSFLCNGRHGGVQHVQQKKSEYEIFMKREKIYLTFTFKGWFSSAILNFLFKSQTNCYWWFAFYHMLMTMRMIMSSILSSCHDLRYPETRLWTNTRSESDPKSKTSQPALCLWWVLQIYKYTKHNTITLH